MQDASRDANEECPFQCQRTSSYGATKETADKTDTKGILQ